MYLFMLADRVGFEPTERLHVLRISNPALSATQPPVRILGALSRTRTGTPLLARDFKSLVSTIPPRGHSILISVYAWEVLNAFAPPILTNDKHLPAYLHRAFCCDCDITSHHMGLANPY